MSKEDERSVPVPISVTLYNLLALPSETRTSTLTPSSRNALFRPEYTTELLVSVRLDIVLGTATIDQNNTLENRNDDFVLFSAPQDRGALHPCWDHLDERCRFWDEEQNNFQHQQGERDPVYRSLRLRIVTSRHQDDQTTKPRAESIADMPLHPALLRRLPEEIRDGEGDTAPWEQRPPPRALPPNAILVNFSDGSTRVDPPLYHLLLAAGIIVETNPKDESLLQDEAEENRRQLRFTDDVFDKLDGTAAWWDDDTSSPTVMKRKRSPSSLLETDDESQAVPVSPLKDETDLYGDAFEDTNSLHGKVSGDASGGEESGTDGDNDILAVEDLQHELEALHTLVQMEQDALDRDFELLNQRKREATAVVDEEKRIRKEIIHIQLESEKAQLRRREATFLLDAQRMKLLRDLRSIYYIQSQPEHRYFIRDQEIPSDVFSGTVPEEEVSAAMGFLCNSIVMISKYLSIPLPYRIICNSSRSAIQGGSSNIYPLFSARAVDRQQAEKGMDLLERNLDCIIKNRGIHGSAQLHILGKVKRIYDCIIEGS